MLFKLINASIIFQTYINKALKKLVDIIYIIYLNNILIFNKNLTKHQRHEQQIFERLKDFELYINFKKCEFNIEKVEFISCTIFIKEI